MYTFPNFMFNLMDMDSVTLYTILACLASLIGGFGLGYGIQRSRARARESAWHEKLDWNQRRQEELKEEMSTQQNEIAGLNAERGQLRIQLARQETLNAELQTRLGEQKKDLEQIEEKMQQKFEILANKILEEKGNRFADQNKKSIKEILEPLGEKIRDFEKKVQDSQKEQVGLHASLKQQLENLKDQNLRITQEAENLTRALKGDNKAQGNWGELVLERVLEKSGLEKDLVYSVQQSFRTEDGRRIVPDVVVNLPDGKKMVIDSKVSLSAYERFVNASDEDERARAGREHMDSLNRHIQQLSDKKYEDIYQMESPDFVLMFVPIEPAFAAALQQDNHLFSKAFDRNIVIVTPTTLLATLKTIESMWSNEKQRRNAIEIATVAGNMYDKFVSFTQDLIQVGQKMDAAKKEYAGAMSKLTGGRGNLVSYTERLKKLGAKAKKSLPDSILERSNDSLNPNE